MTRGSRPAMGRPMAALAVGYVVWIVVLSIITLSHAGPAELRTALSQAEIRASLRLSLVSSTLAALAAVWVSVPLGYALSRRTLPLHRIVDTLVDVPIVLPPLVVGLMLLLTFQTAPGRWFEQRFFSFSLAAPGVVLAQFTVVTALAVRTMQATFDRIDPRREQVARTLGCTPAQAFWEVAWPAAQRGALTAGAVAWARSFGEFGPILVFCGTTPFRTEVLPTSVYLALNSGELSSAVAISTIMMLSAVVVLGLARWWGVERL